MRYQAVIFDLGGTLVRTLSWADYAKEAEKVAGVLGAPPEKFVELWFQEASGLGVGLYADFKAFIKHICDLLQLKVPENKLALAAEMPAASSRKYLTIPREGTMETIQYLKSHNYKIGLISDCGPDVPEIWDEIPFAPYFDVTVFSCDVKMNKGNPEIFNTAIKKLDVKPEKCIYVADGNRNELTNAGKLGMLAIQLFVPGENNDSPVREEWHGETVSSLQEILNYLEEKDEI